MLLFSSELISLAYQCKITSLKFLEEQSTTPEAINDFEERYQYNWTSVKPFIEILYSPLVHNKSRSGTEDETENRLNIRSQTWSLKIALFALKTEMLRVLLRNRTKEEELLDFIVMLSWNMPAECKSDCLDVTNLFFANGNLPVPKLVSIARACLARNGITTGLQDVHSIMDESEEVV